MRDFPVTAEAELSAAEKFRLSLELFELGERMTREALRRQHPEADDSEVERLLVAWLQERPGAELGDADGRPCRRPSLES